MELMFFFLISWLYDVYISGYIGGSMMYTSVATWLHDYRQMPARIKKNSLFLVESVKML